MKESGKKRRTRGIATLLAVSLLFTQTEMARFENVPKQAKAAENAQESLYERNAGRNFGTEGKSPFGLKTLIVKTELEEFDTFGAESKLSFGDGVHALYYADEGSTEAALSKYQKMDGILFAETDVPVRAQTKTDSENTKEEGTGSDQGGKDDLEEREKETAQENVFKEEEAESGVSEKAGKEESLETETEILNSKETEISNQENSDAVVRVAVIDTGADMGDAKISPYLQDTGFNVSGSGNRQSIADDNGHGTVTAKIIVSALKENGRDENTVKILPVKALNADGEGSVLGVYLGIKEALKEGADLINLGLLAETKSRLLEMAVEEAYAKGTAVIAAAGNTGKEIGESSPAGMEKALVVSSVKNRKERSEESAYGATVDFCAYGSRQGAEGTSAACAYVTGVTASFDKGISLPEMENALKERAARLTEEGKSPYFGYGLIGDAPEKKEEQKAKKEEDFAQKSVAERDGMYAKSTVRRADPSERYFNPSVVYAHAVGYGWVSWVFCGGITRSLSGGELTGLREYYLGVDTDRSYASNPDNCPIHAADSPQKAGYGPVGMCALNTNINEWFVWEGRERACLYTGQNPSATYYAGYSYKVAYYKNDGTKNKFGDDTVVGNDLNGAALKGDVPNRKGYAFQGWSLNKDASSPDQIGDTIVTAGTHVHSITPSGESTTRNLYAVWKPVKYKVKYDKNGGTGTMENTSHTYDIAQKLQKNEFKRTGYEFKGWSVSKNGKKQYGNEQSVKNLTAGNGNIVTLYAVWEPVKYKVHYEGNGATEGSMDDSSHIYDTEKKLSANAYRRSFQVTFDKNYPDDETDDIVPGCAKAAFDGWMKKADGISADYKNQQKVKNLSSKKEDVVILHAKWKDGKVELPNPEREGYDLLGWSTDQNAKKRDKGYKPGARVTVSSEKKLYAVWKLKTYKITYDANGGEGNMEEGMKKHGKEYTISKNAFFRTGYDFAGWNTKPDGSGTFYAEGEKYRDNRPVTFYAVWRENYVVAYIGNRQTKGQDFLDDGKDHTGYSERINYIFDENRETGKEEEEHFKKEEEKIVYKDQETGEDIKQKISGTVVGWSADADIAPNEMENSEIAYKIGEEIPGSKLMESARKAGAVTYDSPNSDYGTYPKTDIPTAVSTSVRGVEMQKAAILASAKIIYGGVPYINLYAVWDKGPVIEAYDRYYTLEEAQDGFITEEELLNAAKATDEEAKSSKNPKGCLKNFQDEEQKTSFTVWDYQAEEFTDLHASAKITLTYRAKDSVGNVTDKMITVHVADSGDVLKEAEKGNVRFISKKHLDTLDADSIWAVNAEYRAVLEEAVSYERINPETSKPLPVFGKAFETKIPGTGAWNKSLDSIWTFTQTQVKEAQAFVKSNGPADYKDENGLEKFLTAFAGCKN